MEKVRGKVVLFILMTVSLNVWGQGPCLILLSPLSDPIAQLMEWEVTNNQIQWREKSGFIQIRAAVVPSSHVSILQSQGAPAFLIESVSGAEILAPQHPYNTSPAVPFFSGKPTTSVAGHMSASRSVYFFNPDHRLYSAKTPTDHPHQSVTQPLKADLHLDAVTTIRRSDHIHAVDSLFGPPPGLILLPDSISLMDKSNENAWILRDLSRLQDGHYYLPAFSIPYVGRRIATKFGEDFSLFWAKHYAEASGRAKALLLTRYGLQMVTPNAQNFLIQLDRDLRPTGVIVIRDLGDTIFSSTVSWKLGFGRQLTLESRTGLHMIADMRPAWKGYGDFQMDSPEAGVSEVTSNIWLRAHMKGYINQINNSLQIPPQVGAGLSDDRSRMDAIERCVIDDCNHSFFKSFRDRKWLGRLIVRAQTDVLVRNALLDYFTTDLESRSQIASLIGNTHLLPAVRADLVFKSPVVSLKPKPNLMNLSAANIQTVNAVRAGRRPHLAADKILMDSDRPLSISLAIAIADVLSSQSQRGQRSDRSVFTASYLSTRTHLSVADELLLRGAIEIDPENDELIETLTLHN